MNNALYVDVVDVVECNIPCVCENASMSVYPHACDDMLHDFLGGVKIPNVKLLKKKFKKFHENLSKFTSENDNLIAKLNESNKLVEKYKKLTESSFEKMKEFECLNVELDAKIFLCEGMYTNLSLEVEHTIGTKSGTITWLQQIFSLFLAIDLAIKHLACILRDSF